MQPVVYALDNLVPIVDLGSFYVDVLKDRLYTAGELLKTNQLTPDREEVPAPKQLQLFALETP